MIILLVILVITFIFILGAGLVFLQMFTRKKPVPPTKTDEQAQPADKFETKT